MKIEVLIPVGWRLLAESEYLKKNDLWLDRMDIVFGMEWYSAFDKDPNCNMVGELVGNSDKAPNGIIAIREIVFSKNP